MDYIYILLAVLCLWMPGTLIASSEIKQKLRQSNRRQHEGLAGLLRSKFNWFDLARATAGVWLLQRQIASFHNLDEDTRTVLTVVQILVLLIGVLAQTFWLGEKVSIIGPLFYLSGIVLAACGPIVGAFSLVLGVNCALMLRRVSSSFVFIAVSIGIFALLFHKLGLTTLASAGLMTLPMLLSFAIGGRITFVRRAPAKSRRRRAHPNRVVTTKHVFDGDVAIPAKEMVPDHGFGGNSTITAAGRSRYSETW